jgi:hypothetical protein
MTPEEFRAWQRVLRDFMLIAAGTFVIVFATLTVRDPAVLTILLGAGMGLFGLPPFLRLDAKRRSTDTEEE